jgi:hypothetical protein
MASRGLKVWRFALRILMKVNGVLARRQVLQIHVHLNPATGLRYRGGADIFTLSVLQMNYGLG